MVGGWALRIVSDRFQTGPCVYLKRLSKSFYLTPRPKFIHRWPRDSSIISFGQFGM